MTIKIELGKERRDGTAAVYVKITQKGVRKRIPTLVNVKRSDYTMTKNGIRIKNLSLKQKIDEILLQIQDDLLESPIVVSNPSANDVRKVVMEKSTSRSFTEFAKLWLENCDLKGKKNYVSAINSMTEYARREDILFSDVTVPFLQGWESSLKDRPRAQSMYLNAVAHIWKQAEIYYDVDCLPRSPFTRFKPKKQKPVGQRAVGMDVILRIYNFKGTAGRAMLARDCFILSFCLMGMNAVDLYSCTSLKKGVLSYERSKVKDRRADKAHTEIYIHPFINDIVKKYKSTGSHVFNFSTRYSTPADFTRALNIGLKEILGKNTKVTFYSARHSWATIARNVCKIDKATVNDGLVHVDHDMMVTDLYIMKDFSIINDANKKVIETVFAEYI